MNRFDQLIGKKAPKKPALDGIAEDIQRYRDEYGGDAEQTTIRGKNLAIRGPNGFQVIIPVRHVQLRETNVGVYELCLAVSPQIGQTLRADIESSEHPNSGAYPHESSEAYRIRSDADSRPPQRRWGLR